MFTIMPGLTLTSLVRNSVVDSQILESIDNYRQLKLPFSLQTLNRLVVKNKMIGQISCVTTRKDLMERLK